MLKAIWRWLVQAITAPDFKCALCDFIVGHVTHNTTMCWLMGHQCLGVGVLISLFHPSVSVRWAKSHSYLTDFADDYLGTWNVVLLMSWSTFSQMGVYIPLYLIGPWEIWIKSSKNNFQVKFSDWWLLYLKRNCPQMNTNGLQWWYVNIGSGNGLVPSGNAPLPEPMLT